MCLNFFGGKVELIKALEGFGLMTYRLVVNTLTHCATLSGIYCGKEKIIKYKIILN